jgi:DNA-directed RNA polymerase specialized sigma24 family protein
MFNSNVAKVFGCVLAIASLGILSPPAQSQVVPVGAVVEIEDLLVTAISEISAGSEIAGGAGVAADEALLAGETRLAISPKTVGSFLTSTEQRSAAEMLPKFCAGDDAALGVLQKELNPALGRYFRAAGRKSAEVEELSQDVWEKLVRARNSGNCPQEMTSVAGWLLRVSRNLNVSLAGTPSDAIMRAAMSMDPTAFERLESEGGRLVGFVGANPQNDLELMKLCMGAMVESFKPLDRQIAAGLMMEMRQAEIAEHLELSEASVSRRVSWIRETLAACR